MLVSNPIRVVITKRWSCLALLVLDVMGKGFEVVELSLHVI
jgi:hypothetical protein